MRRFRFKGNPDEYVGIEDLLIQNKVYYADYPLRGANTTVIHAAKHYPDKWEEVTEPIEEEEEDTVSKYREAHPEKKAHKDTDLGFFTGLALQGILSNGSDLFVRMKDDDKVTFAGIMAKALIEALDKEVGCES